MGSGCFRPKQGNNEVFFQTITAIYQYTNKQPTLSENNFQQIKKSAIVKKYLQKLFGYLLSHRLKLLESLQLIYHLTIQYKSTNGNFTSLVIIGDILFRINNQSEQQIKSIKINENINISNSYIDQNKSFKSINQDHSIKQFNLLYLIKNQINNCKCQNLCLQIILYLLQQQNMNNLYQQTIDLLINYIIINNEKIIHDKTINKILEILINKIIKQKNKNYLETYNYLLTKIQSDLIRNQTQLYLQIFIQIWFQLQQCQQNFEQSSIQLICKNIITIYITNNLQNWSCIIPIYQTIILIYDKYQFSQIFKLQQLFINITQNLHLNNNFFRILSRQLMLYIAVCQNIHQRWSIISELITYQKISHHYKKIFSIRNKIGSLNTITRWSQKGYFNINQIATNNCCLLIYTFLWNIYNTNNQVSKCAFHNLIILCNQIEIKIKIHVINFIYSEIHWSGCLQIHYNILLKIIKEISKQIECIQVEHLGLGIEFCRCITVVSYNDKCIFSQVLADLLSKMTIDALKIHIDSICIYLHSIYQTLLTKELPLSQLYKLTLQVENICAILLFKKAHSLILCYLNQILKCINSPINNKIIIILLYSKIMSLLDQNISMSPQLTALQNQIQKQKQYKLQEQISNSLSQQTQQNNKNIINLKLNIKNNDNFYLKVQNFLSGLFNHESKLIQDDYNTSLNNNFLLQREQLTSEVICQEINFQEIIIYM